jgi:putative tryptophan/tyrosine transport system substrate-binding protein
MFDPRRRQFITLLCGAVAWPLAARAQQAERVRRISMVNVIAETDPEASPRVAVFETALRKLGWTERDLRIDYHWGASDIARIRAVAKELVATRPDLIVTVTTPPTQAVRDETRDIPVLFLQVFDPVSTGLVASLARPGGNITGFTNFEPSMASKWLQLLKEIAPRVKRVALLFNPTTTIGSQLYIDSIEAASRSFAVEPATVHVRSTEDVSEALLKLASDPDAGLIVVPDTFTTNNRDLITSVAARHRVPAVYPFRYFATVGGLLTYGIDATDLFHRSASYVDAILKGARPADLPVQQPTKFELVINLKTAKALGLQIPDKLLALADEVIE